jgi:adenylate kinase
VDLILMGPPGVGKGTQAELLKARTGLAHLATGDLLRRHLREGTELGLTAQTYMDRGELVPDRLVTDMTLEIVLAPEHAGGVILDGFPRTLGQAGELAAALTGDDRRVDAAVLLTAPRRLLLRRIVGRQTCQICGAAFNIFYTPSREEAVCDLCGGELRTRRDDNMETARHRLDVYLAETAPLIEFYREQRLLREIDGSVEVTEVADRVLAEIGLGPSGPPG